MSLKTANLFSLFLALNLIFSLAFVWYILCFYNRNMKISVIVSPLINLKYSQQIKNIVESGLYKSGPDKIFQDLKSEIPAIKAVSKKTKSSVTKLINISAEKPIFKIVSFANSKQIEKLLTSDGKIINKECYSPEFYENIYEIYLKNISIDLTDNTESLRILNFMKNIKTEILDDYDMTWHDKTLITFCNKTDNNFYIKTEYETGLTPEKLSKIDILKNKTKSEQSNRKKRNNIWCADIRFGDKIVLTLKGEGEHEGKKFIG